MRISIIITALLIIAIGVAYFLDSLSAPVLFVPSLGILAFGALNAAFGILTRKGTGVSIPSDSQGAIKMIVDRGVIASTIYIMTFTDRRLVLKKLTSGYVTILAVIAFAVVGFSLGFIIGGIVGAITAFSLQEFLTQQKREAIVKRSLLDSIAKGDLEFTYDYIEGIQLTRARLRLFLKNGILGIVISRKYPAKIRPILQEIVPKAKIRETS